MDPYFVTYPYYPCFSCVPAYRYGIGSTYNQFMTYPTMSPEPSMVVSHFPYWFNSNCSIFNLPNNGARFGVGSTPNYIGLMGSYSWAGVSMPRIVQGDDYGDRGSSTCYGAFSDITSTDLLLGAVNVVRNGGLNDMGEFLYNIESVEPTTLSDTRPNYYACQYYSPGDPVFYRQSKSGVREPNTTVNISPNPANDYLIVTWASKVDQKNDQISIFITDMLGKQVEKANPSISSAGTSKLDLRSIAPGIYYVSCFVNGELVKTTKLSILK
jgi:hypothetical protein